MDGPGDGIKIMRVCRGTGGEKGMVDGLLVCDPGLQDLAVVFHAFGVVVCGGGFGGFGGRGGVHVAGGEDVG